MYSPPTGSGNRGAAGAHARFLAHPDVAAGNAQLANMLDAQRIQKLLAAQTLWNDRLPVVTSPP